MMGAEEFQDLDESIDEIMRRQEVVRIEKEEPRELDPLQRLLADGQDEELKDQIEQIVIDRQGLKQKAPLLFPFPAYRAP